VAEGRVVSRRHPAPPSLLTAASSGNEKGMRAPCHPPGASLRDGVRWLRLARVCAVRRSAGGIDVGELLDAVEAGAPIDSVPVVAARLAEMVDAREVHFLITDFTGRAVVRLTSTGRVEGARSHGVEQAETVPLAGTVYGRVLRTQQTDVQRVDAGARAIIPVTNRGDAIGLLELVLPALPAPQDLATIETAAHALAYVLVAARRHTDVYEWGMRSTPFSLAAEIQRRLLPAAYTCEAGQFTLAGWLEPAAAVGGDTFDYNLDRDFLHVSITDAVGHQVEASLLATLLVGSLRNGRRKGLDLAAQAAYANDSLAGNAAPGHFVTGQLVRVDLHSGTAVIVNAGHTLPLRLRGGAVEEIELHVEPPFGVLPGKAFRAQPFPLEPGDRIVFLTDGMRERNAASLDVAAALADTAGEHPREVVHALGAAVLKATGGNLRDDATMVCLDWYGGPPRARTSEQGADPGHASPSG
jgi:serine phosphatase RsbU (regulator of sigma subunit)